MSPVTSKSEKGAIPRSSGEGFKNASFILFALVAAAGWSYVIYGNHRANDPIEIVKKHFVFYPEYSHGIWREGRCSNEENAECREVTYTTPLEGCGPVTFDWTVFPGKDADAAWSYNGTNLKIDENKYPLYAVLNEDSRFINSPALGAELPTSCQVK